MPRVLVSHPRCRASNATPLAAMRRSLVVCLLCVMVMEVGGDAGSSTGSSREDSATVVGASGGGGIRGGRRSQAANESAWWPAAVDGGARGDGTEGKRRLSGRALQSEPTEAETTAVNIYDGCVNADPATQKV